MPACSVGSRSWWLHSTAARTVRWCGGESRPPPPSMPSRVSRLERTSAGDMTLTRAAASSIASGRRSSRAHSWAIVASVSSLGMNSGSPLPRPFDEQAICVLGPERLQPPDRFPADAERLAAGGHDPNLAARGEQGGGELGAGVHHVLAVVEDEQQVAVGQVPAQRILRGGSTRAANLQRPGRLGCDVGRLGSPKRDPRATPRRPAAPI